MTQQNFMEIEPRGSAVLSPCGLYRYQLRRLVQAPLGRPKRVLGWVMLNPSKADADRDDTTMTKVQEFTRRAGFHEAAVVNLFAWRSTDPRGLGDAGDPVGDANDQHILAVLHESELLVCAWGNGAAFGGGHRVRAVVRMLEPYEYKLRVLKVTGTGEPGHPLMLPYWRPLVPFKVSSR